MLQVFSVCFWVGVAVTVINAVLGLIFGIFDFGLDIDIDLDFGDFDLGAFLPLSPTMFFLFLIVFGGSGMILSKPMSDMLWLALVIAIVLGFGVIALLNIFVVKPLRKISSKETAALDDFVGMTGKVTEKIYENGFGKITIICDGNTVTGPAKSSTGQEISVGTEIFIEKIDSKVYIVDLLERKQS